MLTPFSGSPSQSRSARLERSENCRKARLLADPVPCRIVLEHAVIGRVRNLRKKFELIQSAAPFPRPGVDQRERATHLHAIYRVLGKRPQRDPTPAFTERILFPPKSGINQAERSQQVRIVRLLR